MDVSDSTTRNKNNNNKKKKKKDGKELCSQVGQQQQHVLVVVIVVVVVVVRLSPQGGSHLASGLDHLYRVFGESVSLALANDNDDGGRRR